MEDDAALTLLEKKMREAESRGDAKRMLLLEQELDAAAEAMLLRAGLIERERERDKEKERDTDTEKERERRASPRPAPETEMESDSEEIPTEVKHTVTMSKVGNSDEADVNAYSNSNSNTNNTTSDRSGKSEREREKPRSPRVPVSVPASAAAAAKRASKSTASSGGRTGAPSAERERERERERDRERYADAELASLPLDELFVAFAEARRELSASSRELFQAQQSLQKLHEDLKTARRERTGRRETHIEEMVVCALRDSELRFQKEQLLNAEQDWAAVLEEDQRCVQEARNELAQALSLFRDTRREITEFQDRVRAKSQDLKTRSLNAVAFFRYAKHVLEHELQRPSSAPVSFPTPLSAREALPSRREAQKAASAISDRVQRERDSLLDFYRDRVLNFRRQERILLGRAREMSEIASAGAAAAGKASRESERDRERAYDAGTAASSIGYGYARNARGVTTGEREREQERDKERDRDRERERARENKRENVTDCYEFRVAQRILSVLDNGIIGSNNAGEGEGGEKDSDEEFFREKEAKGRGKDREKEKDESRVTASQRAAQRTFFLSSPSGSEKRDRDQEKGSDRKETAELVLPAIDAPRATEREPNRDRRHTHRASIAQHTQHAPHPFLSQLNTNGNKSFVGSSSMKEKEERGTAGFDHTRFAVLCGNDAVRAHTLLDVDRGIGDREQKLFDLVVAFAQAKGEIARLSSIKEGLDVHLQKQAAVLCSAIDAIQGTKQPFFSTTTTTTSKPKSLNLPSDSLILRVERLHRQEEITKLQEKLFFKLFPVDSAETKIQ